MKIVVFGVTHWDDEKDLNSPSCPIHNKRATLIEWYNRVFSFIPNPEKVFLAAGTYSDPKLNPLPLELIQIGFKKYIRYSRQNNYFRLGFMTGIWKGLLDYPDFDLLIHVQCTRYLGRDFTPWLNEFMKREEQLMAFSLTSEPPVYSDGEIYKAIDVGFMAMKKPAALMYAATGLRQCCERVVDALNCEEEAFNMFEGSWWNPYPEMPTMRQRDLAHEEGGLVEEGSSKFEITDIDYYKSLPIIANGKHFTGEFAQAWVDANPTK